MFSKMCNLTKCTRNLLLGINGQKNFTLEANQRKRWTSNYNGNQRDVPANTIPTTSGTTDTPLSRVSDKFQIEIVDINVEEMMDNDFVSDYTMSRISKDTANETSHKTHKTGTTAPIDIDPWTDEELKTDGTVEYEKVEAYKSEPLISPPTNDPPKERQGYYEFDGIKIWLPKSMFNKGSYRYRLDPKTKHLIADDMRICKFPKSSVDTKDKN